MFGVGEGKGEHLEPGVHAAGGRREGIQGPLVPEGLLSIVKGIADTGFFPVYRRNKREAIPLIWPPER